MAKKYLSHDEFFKELLAQPGVAADFLQNYLPPEIVAGLEAAAPELIKDTFLDDELRRHLSDLIYRVKTKRHPEAYICVLLEHKSAPQRDVSFQLLRYKVRAWEQLQRQGVKRLPPIIPIVFYHGRRRWRFPTRFSALLDLTADDPLRRYEVEFEFYLCDVTTWRDEDLRGGEPLRAGLRLLKHIFSPDLGARLADIFRPLRTLPLDFALECLKIFVAYLTPHGGKVNEATLKAALHDAVPGKEEQVMTSFVEEWKQRGLQQGMSTLTLKLLKHQLGEIAEETSAQIRALAPAQLEELGEALFGFRTPDDLTQWLSRVSRSVN